MTRADAIRQVLENLRVIDAISAPAAEDASRVGIRLDQETARLSERGLMWWTADDIPDSVAGALCDLVATRCQSIFNKQHDSTGAEKVIAAVKSSERREAVRQDYF